MKAAIYSRKSKFTGKGESVENQIQLCREYGTKYLGIVEADFVIYEDEGFSGGNTNRPQFQKLLKDARARKFDVLICYRLDRISRNVSDFSQLIKELNKFNVNFVSVKEQFDTTTPMGRAMMYIASVFSQLERETIAERIRDNMMQLAKTGRWLGGNPPTGFKSEAVVSTGPDGKERKMYRLVPASEETGLVKLIYYKYLSMKSITQVEKYLVENKIQTKNGQDFHRYSIRFILSNPVYAVADSSMYNYLKEKGYYVCADPDDFNGINGLTGYNKTRQAKGNSNGRYRDSSEWIIAVGLHAGIIPGSIWIEAQELLENNKSKSYRRVKTSQALLSGILRCARCGSFMRPKPVLRYDSEGEQVFYYMCELKEKSRRSRCIIENINGNTLDRAVLKELIEFASKNTLVFDEVPDKKNLIETTKVAMEEEHEILKARIDEVDSEIRNLLAAIAKGQKDEALSVISGKLEELSRAKEVIEKHLAQIQNDERIIEFNGPDLDAAAESLSTWSDNTWGMMDFNDKRRMIKSVVDKILWDGKKVDIMLHGSKYAGMPGIKLPAAPFDLNAEDLFPECKDSKCHSFITETISLLDAAYRPAIAFLSFIAVL